MRIVLFGVPEFGSILLETLLQHQKNVVAVVTPPSDHVAYNATRLMARKLGVACVNVKKSLKDPLLVDEIKSYNPDIILVSAYPRLIPSSIYNLPHLGTINCHPSLLPQYRGANPYFHVIRNGEKETGITYHYLDDTFDTGDIVSQWIVPLLPEETLGTLYVRLSFKASEIYIQLLEKIEKGEVLKRVSQPKKAEGLKGSPEITLSSPELQIDWSESSSSIDALIRASNPYFGARSNYRKMPLKIWAGYYNDKMIIKHNKPPGTIMKLTNSEIAIATATGVYYPTCLQFGNLFTCDTKEFIKRTTPKVGEILN